MLPSDGVVSLRSVHSLSDREILREHFSSQLVINEVYVCVCAWGCVCVCVRARASASVYLSVVIVSKRLCVLLFLTVNTDRVAVCCTEY